MSLNSPPSSPALLGYTTAGEEVEGDSSGSSSDTVGGSPTVPAELPVRDRSSSLQRVRDSHGRFTRKRIQTRSCGDDESIGSATDLVTADSLTWDAHTPPLDVTTGARRWSVSTVASVDREDPGVPPVIRLPTHEEAGESGASAEA